MPLNKDCLGRTYQAPARIVTVEEGLAYAQATMDPTPAVLKGEVLPPVFAVNPLIDVAMKVCRDPELGVDLVRLVHGEEDMRFHRTIRPGETVRPETTVIGVQSKSSGELLLLEHRLLVEEEIVVTSRSSYFIRAPKTDDRVQSTSTTSKAPKAKTPKRPEQQGTPLFSTETSIAADQPLLYAEASRDRNPIHTDEAFARKAGLPGCILHGLCTMAIAAHHVINHAADGDPTRLARISVRFSALVLPEDTLRIEAFASAPKPGVTTLGLKVQNQEGRNVLTKARAEIRS